MVRNIFYLLILSSLAIICTKSWPPDFDTPNYLETNDNPVSYAPGDEMYKLGDETKPSYYKLEISANETARFHGLVEIHFKALEPNIQKIWLNAEHMWIDSDAVKVYSKSEPNTNLFDKLDITLYQKYQKYGFDLKRILSVEVPYIMRIQYTGSTYDSADMRGLYTSHYKQDNQTKTLFTTHFGQQGRRLMPCWDENRFKAQFELIVHRNPTLHPLSVSNAKVKTTEGDTDFYEPTSIISPYLLALVISDFSVNRNGQFAIYARPEAYNQTDFSLSLGIKLLEALDAWTNMTYYEVPGVDKMDIAAIPDFSAGAMENWGLLIYREVNVLFDKDIGNSAQRQRIALIIAHELAHMWFGDIVTCNEFGATWLNEGFARYFQFIALEMVDKDYKAMDQFPVTTLQASFQPDSLSTAHPLTDPGKYSYADIRTMFDSITYDKGGSILRMIHNLMGNTKFQTAIRQYLVNKKMETAVPEDLFVELELQYTGITDIIAPYTKQAGFPLVTVTRVGQELILNQKRFLSDVIDHDDTTTWNIPITVATKEGDFKNTLSQLTVFESKKPNNFTISIKNSSLGFYLLNIQQYGYYRVNYDNDNWIAIGKALKSNYKIIHPINRAQIIDDLFNLARVGYVTYDFAFDIISYVKNERDHLPWLATFNGLLFLEQRVPSDPELKELFEVFVRDLLSGTYNASSTLKGIHKINVLTWACKYGIEDCVNKGVEQSNLVLGGKRISPDTKPAFYCAGISNTSDRWDRMWDLYMSSNYATEQATILTALGCARRRIDIKKLLDKVLTDDIRPQDKSSGFVSSFSGHEQNVDIVFDYIVDKPTIWAQKMSITSTLGDLSARFVREKQFDALDTYLKIFQNDQLNATSIKNRKLLEWDKERLPELKRFVKGSATTHGLSVLMSIALLGVFYFVQ